MSQRTLMLVVFTAALSLVPFSLHAQSSPLTVQPSTGNVGVGTTNPTSKFQVTGGAILLDNNQKVNSKNSVGSPGAMIYRQTDDKVFVGEPLFANDLVIGPGMDLSSPFNPGNVGIGTRSPQTALHVNGSITASVKPFRIDHPLDPENKDLVHAAIEGPEAAVYYRGEAQLIDGEVVIGLPAYFEALTKKENRTVQLTPVGGWSPLYVDTGINNGRFTVKTAPTGSRAQRFYWEVKAVRSDIPDLDVEIRKRKPTDSDWHIPTVDKARRPDHFAAGAR